MNLEGCVVFDYSSHQGVFQVVYSPCGKVSIHAYGRRSSTDDSAFIERGLTPPSDTAIIPASYRGWSHGYDVELDLLELTGSQVVEKYRQIFLNNHINLMGLETSAQGALVRLVFPVVMADERSYDVFLRVDGLGYVLDTLCLQKLHLTAAVRYAAEVPIAFFRHSVDAATIVKDAGTLTALQAGGNPSCGDLSPSLGNEARALADRYADYFWASLNPSLNLSFIRLRNEKEDVPLRLERSDLPCFENLLTMACRLDEQAWSGDAGWLSITINSAVGTDKAYVLDSRDSRDLDKRTLNLLDLIIEWHNPFGYSVVGDRDNAVHWRHLRRIPHSVRVTVDAPTATEKMEALAQLMTWSEQAGIDIGPYLND